MSSSSERVFRTEAEKQAEEATLLAAIHQKLDDLDKLFEECTGKWEYEDPVYRFYHQSYKVYGLQEKTTAIVTQLRALAPHLPLNAWFLQIVAEGTGKQFAHEHNSNWTSITRPIVEAFFHARFMLEMVCTYGKALKEPTSRLPSGWAAVLYLYNLR